MGSEMLPRVEGQELGNPTAASAEAPLVADPWVCTRAGTPVQMHATWSLVVYTSVEHRTDNELLSPPLVSFT